MLIKTFKKFLVESSLSRILRQYQSTTSEIGVITAFLGENKPLENRKRNHQLEVEIREANYGFVRVVGKYIETKKDTGVKEVVLEESFLINSHYNIKQNLVKWMLKYDQEAALFKPLNMTDVFMLKSDGTKDKLGRFGINQIKDYMTFLAKRISTVRKAEADVRSFYLEAVEIPKNIAALLAEKMREQKLSKK